MPSPFATRDDLVRLLDTLAPPALAAEWDNVGLLVDPPPPVRPPEHAARALLTIDLNDAVWAEAVALDVDLVVAYHPPIFAGLRRLTPAVPKGALLLDAIRRGVAIYSPHTALDATADGVCDWLLAAAGPALGVAPLVPFAGDAALGAGRVGTLARPASLDAITARIKAHLGLAHVRVSAAPVHTAAGAAPIRRVAVCPGAGGAILMGCGDVDLVITGEMRHHDVLALSDRGVSAVLTDHSNSERGYLPVLAQRLRAALAPAAVDVRVSAADRDPLEVR